MTRHIEIGNETFAVDTDEQIDFAAEKLRAHGLRSATIWEGDTDTGREIVAETASVRRKSA